MKKHPLPHNTWRLISAVFLCALLCTVHCYTGYGQKLDSLKAVLLEFKNNDTTTVNIMLEMTNSYRDISPDSTEIVARRALAIAQKNDYAMGIGKSYYMIGVAHTMRNQYDSSVWYYEKALAVFHKAGLTDKECMTLYNINVSYYRMRNMDKALASLQKDSTIADQNNNYERGGRAMLAMGDIYRDKGQYADAIGCYLKALSIYEKYKVATGISESYRDIADIYSLIGNRSKAKEYITKASALYQPIGDIQGIIVNYTSVASVYGQLQDYKNSLFYYNKALHLADSIQNHYWLGSCLINVGENYLATGQLDTALSSFTKGLEQCTITHDEVGAAFARRGIGNVLIKKGIPKEGIPHLLEAIEVMKAAGIKREISEISNMLSKAYEQTGNIGEALRYARITYAYNDTLYGENNDKHMQEVQFDYELKKKQGEIELLQKDRIIKQAKLEKQRATQWGLISGIGLLAIVVSLLYISRKREKKNKEMSMAQTAEIQKQATMLEELNQYKDKTFSVLSHDLRGPMNAFSSAMDMLDKDELSVEEFMELKPEINKQINSLNLLLDNLLNWSKSHMQGEKSILTQTIDIHKIAEDNISLVQGTASKKMVTIHNNIPEYTTALADKGQIDVVIRNLINNAIKFTGERGRITLSANENAEDVSISVSDTGVGMTQQQLDKLFKVVTNNSTYGTGGEKGIGLGLLLCYEFIKANKGNITATSEPGKGSTFTITLPKQTG